MMVITNDILSISTSMHLKIKKGGFVCQAHNKTLRALWKGYKLSIYQNLALGLTTVPIPNPQLRVGQLYPPMAPCPYPLPTQVCDAKSLIAISVAQSESYHY